MRDNLLLMLILLLALGWRLLLWAQPLHQPANDEIEYVQVARDLLAGRGWVFYEGWRWLRAPLYPLWLAASLWAAGLHPGLTTAEVLHLAALPNVLLSVVVVYLVYRLARELTPAAGAGLGTAPSDRGLSVRARPSGAMPAAASRLSEVRNGPALLAALVAALLQTYATFGSLYMSETLFSALFAGGLLALAGWRRRGGLWRVALAGALLGLACLTRSAALVFLPVAGLWLLGVARGRGQGWSGALAAPLLLGAAAAAVMAPWTLRNCRAYQECILIETGGAYNLWAFYEPRESLDEINRALEAIPDPVARADEATARGLERLREDPAILLRKPPAEWTRLWVVKPIQDRFLLPSAYSDPPPILFLSALLLDDLLYVLVLCAAATGLARGLARRDALVLLLGLWVAVFVAATMLTHAEGRYRHFLFMALIPLAAVAVDRAPLPRRWSLAAGAALTLALVPLLVFYPWGWAASGAARSMWRGAGDVMAWSGRDGAARQAYQAALAADKTPDGWIALGDLRRRVGDPAEAAEAYELAHATQPTYVGASAAWGDLLREQGRPDEARSAFRGRYLDKQRLLDWSYQLQPPAPAAAVDVGEGLDFGYVGGFYLAEEQQGALARWTDGRGRLRLAPAGEAEQVLLTLRAAAPRPEGEAVTVELCAGGVCEALPLSPTWRTVRVLLPASGVIELRSPTFFAPDGRDLGVLVDWARVQSAAETR